MFNLGNGGQTREAIETQIANMKLGERLHLHEDGRPDHVFVVVAVAYGAIHTGRRQYLVGCSSCSALVAEATTGPLENVQAHIALRRANVR